MNKKILLGSLSVITGGLFATENVVSSFNPYIAVRGGYTMLSKEDGIEYKDGYKGAVEFGISYDAWRLGLEVSYRQNKIKKSENEYVSIDIYDKSNVLAGMINVYYDFVLNEKWSLYIGTGIGIAKFDFIKKESKVEEGKTVFAWQVLAGVAYDVDENWTIEAGYRLFSINKVNRDVDGSAAKVRTPFYHSIEIGLRYNF